METQAISEKGLHTDSLAHRHARDIQGEAELCGFRVKTGGTIIPVLSPPSM